MRAWLLFAIVLLVSADVYFDTGASYDQAAYRKAWVSQAFHSRSVATPKPIEVEWGRRDWRRVDAGVLVSYLNRTPGWLPRFYFLLFGAALFGSLFACTACAAVPGLFVFDRSGEFHRRGARLNELGVPAAFGSRWRAPWLFGALLSLLGYALAYRFAAFDFQHRAVGALGGGYGIAFGAALLRTRLDRIGRPSLRLGHMSIPIAAELYHFLIAGRTGAGKTQAIQ